MRLAICLAVGAAVSCAWLSARADEERPANRRSYQVECKCIDRETGETTSVPKVTLFDGQTANIGQQTQTAVEIGDKQDDPAEAKLADIITTGTWTQVTVRGIDRGRVLIDATFEVVTSDHPGGDEPYPYFLVETVKKRWIGGVSLGQKKIASLGKTDVEITVRAAD